MSYDPEDHVVTAKQALAGWIICVGIVGLALAVTEGRQAIPAATAGDQVHAAAMTGRCALSGIRLPGSGVCTAKREDAVKLAQGAIPAQTGRCG